MTSRNLNFTVILALSTALAGCAVSHGPDNGYVPESWRGGDDTAGNFEADAAALEPALAKLLDATGASMSTVGSSPAASSAKPGWHLEYLMTDLAISTSGKLGLLGLKGTPSVTLHWRRQNDPKPTAPTALADEAPADVVISDEVTAPELAAELEPAVQAAVKSGHVADAARLRANLFAVADDLRELTRGISDLQAGEWKPTRVRLDVAADIAGNVSPGLNVVNAGADVRIRLEWFLTHPKPGAAGHGKRALSPSALEFQSTLLALAEDLQSAGLDEGKLHGFKAYAFRVGIGSSVKGSIGLAKGTGSLIGHVIFSRTVRKPVVKPPAGGGDNGLRSAETLTLVDAGHGTGVKLDRARFRKGIHRAMKIAGFFAGKAGEKTYSHWKVYELKTGFDFSGSKKLGIVDVSGLTTAEVAFYNERF